jgi:hypothetical protein
MQSASNKLFAEVEQNIRKLMKSKSGADKKYLCFIRYFFKMCHIKTCITQKQAKSYNDNENN